MANDVAAPAKKQLTVKYEVNGTEVTLTPDIVRKNICAGATDQEIIFFLMLCKGEKLNPFLKEAYLVKYKDSPATLIISKEAFMKRGEANPQYSGIESGIVVNREGDIKELVGGVKLPSDEIIGGWAKVYRKDRTVPSYVTVAFDEYVQYKTDWQTKEQKPNAMWSGKPATMIRKVAIAQAMREAFPASLNNMYTPEEADSEPKDITPTYSKQEVQDYGKQKVEALKKQQAEREAARAAQVIDVESETGEIIEDDGQMVLGAEDF